MTHPFDRITYTEEEREVSKKFWELARKFYDDSLELVKDPKRYKVGLDHFYDAVWLSVYAWERMHTEKCKEARNR